GIGRGIALKLAAEGANVVVNGTTPSAVAETVQIIRDEGHAAIGVTADVRSEADVQHLIGKGMDEYRRIDILVNNAGVNRDAMFEKMTVDQWDDVVDVHLKGSWLCCKH